MEKFIATSTILLILSSCSSMEYTETGSGQTLVYQDNSALWFMGGMLMADMMSRGSQPQVIRETYRETVKNNPLPSTKPSTTRSKPTTSKIYKPSPVRSPSVRMGGRRGR